MKSPAAFLSGFIAILLVFTTSFSNAQDSTKAVVKIKTSSHCEMSKTTIEKALAFEKGVKKSELDLATKIVTVNYNPKKTNPEKIRKAISNAGYDADDVKANPVAYNKLEACCKKTAVCEDKK